MAKSKKRTAGRPSLGAAARNRLVTIKLTESEHAAIATAVERENAEIIEHEGDDGTRATVSSWIRDHALDPLLGLHR